MVHSVSKFIVTKSTEQPGMIMSALLDKCSTTCTVSGRHKKQRLLTNVTKSCGVCCVSFTHSPHTGVSGQRKEKIQPLGRSLGFLLVYLFIYFSRIPSLFPRSEVQLRNVFPLKKEKLTHQALPV